MPASEKPPEIELISRELCLKEIPVSVTQIEEATDYAVYFRGLERYEPWKKQSPEQQTDPGD